MGAFESTFPPNGGYWILKIQFVGFGQRHMKKISFLGQSFEKITGSETQFPYKPLYNQTAGIFCKIQIKNMWVVNIHYNHWPTEKRRNTSRQVQCVQNENSQQRILQCLKHILLFFCLIFGIYCLFSLYVKNWAFTEFSTTADTV